MEYIIAIFVGLWIACAGLLSYARVSKDYKNLVSPTSKEDILK